jgi:hypothetical protein
VKTKDIIDLTKILNKEIANNDNDSNSNEKIDYETLLSRLEKYRNLESVIENLAIDKDELMGQIVSIMSIRHWLAGRKW